MNGKGLGAGSVCNLCLVVGWGSPDWAARFSFWLFLQQHGRQTAINDTELQVFPSPSFFSR